MTQEPAGICTACGLCCDGALFSGVPLEPHEVEPAQRLGLRVLQREVEQPCTALSGCRCTIYAERPGACRRFECRLLARGGPEEARLATVRRARALLALLRGSGLSPAAIEAAGPSELASAWAELSGLLERDFARA